jgi:hypothetical protein
VAVGCGTYHPGMDLDDLPDGLPPGRLVTPNPTTPDPRWPSGRWTGGPAYWVSQEPLPDAFGQWARLQAIQDRTGLRPLLLDHWTEELWPCDPGQIDALDAETILLRQWRTPEFVRYLDEAAADVAGRTAWRDEIPETAWVPNDPGPPFATWPGLARPGTRGRNPDAVAREVVARNLLPFWLYDRPVHLGLVPAARSADVPAVTGLENPSSHLDYAEVSAVLRSWEDRFGARVVAWLGGLYVSVAAPPLLAQQAEQLALEHLLFCRDVLSSPPVWTFLSYAQRILGADLWWFNWL